jgi:hypothetical protein
MPDNTDMFDRRQLMASSNSSYGAYFALREQDPEKAEKKAYTALPGMGSGSGPHPFGRWNYTDRKVETCYNNHFAGKTSTLKSLSANKLGGGYDSVAMKFPQGSFSSCEYPHKELASRPLGMTNWHMHQDEESEANKPETKLNKHGEWHPTKVKHDFAKETQEELGMTAEEIDEAVRIMGAAKEIKGDAPDFIPKDLHRHHLTKLRAHEVYRPSVKFGQKGALWNERTRGWTDLEKDQTLERL